MRVGQVSRFEMILVPELQTIVLLSPRTASGALYRAVLRKYPKAIMPYRHMEASGVPRGYDHWRKVGIVRHPVERLWSLYNFILKITRSDGGFRFPMSGEYRRSLLDSAHEPFNSWLISNRHRFPGGDRNTLGEIDPMYHQDRPEPENRKSQWWMLRPDLGTRIYKYENDGLLNIAADLNLDSFETHNESGVSGKWPALDSAARDHLLRTFEWEFTALRYLIP